MWYLYSLFGLTVKTEIPFAQNTTTDKTVDVTVEYGLVPEHLPNAVQEGILFQASPEAFLLKVDRIARYFVSGGNRIVIKPEQNAHEDDIRLFLMGSVMGALLHQRSFLPLHASAVEINGKCVLFTGPSGRGKSTLAAGFARRGTSLFADDICAVSIDKKGSPRVVPGFEQLKLWEDTLSVLDLDVGLLKSVRFGKTLKKYYLPVSQFRNTTSPVHSVFVLDTHNEPHILISQFKGMQKIEAIIENTYRVNFLDGFKRRQQHFDLCKKMAEAVSIYHIARPHKPHPFDLDGLIHKVEACLS